MAAYAWIHERNWKLLNRIFYICPSLLDRCVNNGCDWGCFCFHLLSEERQHVITLLTFWWAKYTHTSRNLSWPAAPDYNSQCGFRCFEQCSVVLVCWWPINHLSHINCFITSAAYAHSLSLCPLPCLRWRHHILMSEAISSFCMCFLFFYCCQLVEVFCTCRW